MKTKDRNVLNVIM